MASNTVFLIKLFYVTETIEEIQNKISEGNEGDMTERVQFKCSMCDLTLDSMLVLRNHMKSHKFLMPKLKKRYLRQDNNNQKPSKKQKKKF